MSRTASLARRARRAAGSVLLCLGVLVAVTVPAGAAGSWIVQDVSIRVPAAPALLDDGMVFASASNLTTETPAGRVLYRSADRHINELVVLPGGWTWLDLTRKLQPLVPAHRASALLADDFPFGYTTYLSGQSAVSRVVYRSPDGHIQEISLWPDRQWRWTDLTESADAPLAAVGALPVAYESNLSGQGPMARVVYRSADGHVQEISGGSDGKWHWGNLTAIASAPRAVGAFTAGFATDRIGRGPMARVVYLSAARHVIELKVGGGVNQWRHTDLTQDTRGPLGANVPHAYVTNLSGQQVARVVYVSDEGNVRELYLNPDEVWRGADLTAIALWSLPPPPLGRAPKAGLPIGYTTNLAGQGHVARVVFRQPGSGHVWELSVGGDGVWRGANLSSRTGAPPATSDPFGYATTLIGQGQKARVVFRSEDGHLQELSVS